MTKTKYPAEYRQLLHRYTELRKAGRFGLTQEEREEMEQVAAQMERYEVAQAYEDMLAVADDPFRLITTDYEAQQQYGDYGGVELL